MTEKWTLLVKEELFGQNMTNDEKLCPTPKWNNLFQNDCWCRES